MYRLFVPALAEAPNKNGGTASAGTKNGIRRYIKGLFTLRKKNNRSEMNRIMRILGIYKFECASITNMEIQVHPSPFTVHFSPFTIHLSPFTLHCSPFTVHYLISFSLSL